MLALSASPRVAAFRQALSRPLGLELWVVGGLVLAGMVSSRMLPYAAWAALGFWLLRLVAEGRLAHRTPADWGVALMLLMVPVTLWATAQPEITIPQVYRLLGGIALFYAIANWARSTTRLAFLVDAFGLAGLGLALTAPFTIEWAGDKLHFIPEQIYTNFRLFLTDAIHPNVMGAALGLLVPLSAAVLLFGWKSLSWRSRLLHLAAAPSMVAVLVLTQSRGAWMGTAAALGLLCLLRWRWAWIPGLLALGGGIFAVYRIYPMATLPWLVAISGLDGRMEIWSRAIFMIQDFSFTGVGMGSFGSVADLLYPFFLASPGGIPHAHNLFLQVAVDLGMPGLLGWLAAWLAVLFASACVCRTGRHCKHGWLFGLGAGLLAGQLALFIHSLTDAPLWGMTRPAPLIWAVWGLATAAHTLATTGTGQTAAQLAPGENGTS